MIERHWKGLCKPEKALHYLEHLIEETFNQLELIVGYKGARLLKRNTAEGVEFLVITFWDSLQAIREFSGDDLTVAIVPTVVSEMMISYDKLAIHYELEREFNNH